MTEFDKIYKKYFKDVFLYIKGLSGDEKIAEDVTAETFLKALESIDRFKGTCDIRVWLCQIAKNTYFSYLRKNKRFVEIDNLDEQIAHFDVEQIVANSELSMKAHKILHTLDEPYKEVFSLRVFGELSFKQIAHLFDKTENWACVTYHRAKNKMKERMENLK